MAAIGIVGFGIVGSALAHGFKGHAILFHDKYKDSTPLKEVAEKSEFIFVCVPTPMKSDESGIDLSIIEDVIAQLTLYTDNTNKIIIIKSTVVPGTTLNFEKKYPKSKFAMNPEFLTEANYLNDFVNATRHIVGANNKIVGEHIKKLYQQQFPDAEIYLTNPTSAEMVKYMANTFLAMKVLFANEIYDVCQALDIDYNEIKKLVTLDPRIFDSHLSVSPERGFGGKCFPKDMVALIGKARELGVDPSLLQTVWQKNKQLRKIRDW